MLKKEKYKKPALKIEKLKVTDIITTSPGGGAGETPVEDL